MNVTEQAARVPKYKGREGVVPKLGLGTFQLEKEDCKQAVSWALEAGYRHLDTARMYENEQYVGAGLSESGVDREDVFITTKLQMGELHPEGVKESCTKSLELLDTSYVDLLLIHWPEKNVPLAETMAAMTELKNEGKVKHLGVSNFTVQWLEDACKSCLEPVFCNQIEFHPFLQQQKVLDTCRKHQVAVTAYSPLARGRVMDESTLKELGEKYSKTPAQITLHWMMQCDDLIAVPKGSSKQHIHENMEIFDFEMDPADLDKVSGLDRNQRLIDPDFAPEWDK